MNDPYPSRCAAAPDMLRRLDPVFHGQWHSAAPLSLEESGQFDRDGYLVLRDVLSAAEVALLQAEARHLVEDPSALDPETMISEPGSGEVRSIFSIHTQNRLMARLAEDERLARIASYLLGDRGVHPPVAAQL